MTDKQTATKLLERVNDWQSYLGQSETPRNTTIAPPSSLPVSGDSAETVSTSAPELAAATTTNLEATATLVEVVPPASHAEKNGSAQASATIIEVLPPARPTIEPKRIPRRQMSERELKGVLFNDTRNAEAEYNHARRANAVLSVFVIMLLGVLFTVISWLVVD